ncbi:MAG: hypothetical protein U1E52_01925 [Geminicoccaceae bacterium]
MAFAISWLAPAFMIGLATMAGAAQAADVPGNRSTTATIAVSRPLGEGAIDFAGDSDWYKISLVKGKDYAVQIYASEDITVSIRDKNGNVLKSKINDPDEIAGFEFRANYSGNYFIEYKDRLTDVKAYPFRYHKLVSYDCKADASTGCSLALNDNRKWLFTFAQDLDWMAISLTKGKRYRIDLGAIGYFGVSLSLVNAAGTTLKRWDRNYDDSQGSHYVISNFSPANSGKYYIVAVGNEDNDFEYRVLATSN